MTQYTGIIADKILRRGFTGDIPDSPTLECGEKGRVHAHILEKVIEAQRQIKQKYALVRTATSLATNSKQFSGRGYIGSLSDVVSDTFAIPVLTIEQLGDMSDRWDVTSWFEYATLSNARVLPITTNSCLSQYYHSGNKTVFELINDIRLDLYRDDANIIANRIEYLFGVAQEELPNTAISVESLQGFISFLRLFRNVICPELVLSPSGNIRAEWTRDHNNHFAVEFVNFDVRYVVFSPLPKYAGRVLRSSGIATIDSVMDVVSPHKVNEWITQNTTVSDS